jgi:hypothetical protein
MKEIIKIKINPTAFRLCNNGRSPNDSMDLRIYAEKVMQFIKNAIAEENSSMVAAVWMEEFQTLPPEASNEST